MARSPDASLRDTAGGPSTPTDRPGARLATVRPAAVWLAASLAIVLIAWPIPSTRRTGLDFSWSMALHEAVADGLRHGHDLVFTYGPLGFLSVPTPFVGVTSALAFVASGLLYLGLVALVLRLTRRLFPWWLAIVVTILLARTLRFLPPWEALQALTVMLGVEILGGRLAVSWRWVAVGAGALAALTLLGKLNIGVFVVALAAVVAFGAAPRPLAGVGLYATSLAATGLGLWLLAGQQLGDLVPYGRGAGETIAGYSEAMGTDRDPLLHWIYLAWALVVALLGWLAYRTSVNWPLVRRLALGALLVVVAFSMWKTSFVRGYPGFAFASALFAGLALLRPSAGRETALVTLLALGVVLLGAGRPQPVAYLDVVGSVRNGLVQARDALLPFRWDRVAEQSRLRLRNRYDVPEDALAALHGHTVHVDPFETGVVTAYPDLDWRPLPVFQSYGAYTVALDRLNEAALRDPRRPERILREFRPLRVDGGRQIPLAVDGRLYWFDSPAATVERLCRYREVFAGERWQVLADTGAACAEAIPLGRVDAASGARVDVPAAAGPDQLVLVRVHGLEPDPPGRLRTALWKAPEWYVELDGFEYRFVPGTAAQGLVLAVPDRVQGSEPFRFGDAVATIGLRERDAPGGRPLVFEFFALPLPPS